MIELAMSPQASVHPAPPAVFALNSTVTWREFVTMLQTNPEAVPRTTKGGLLWTPHFVKFATMARGHCLELKRVHMIVFDLDNTDQGELAQARARGHVGVIHETFTEGHYRIILPLTEPIPFVDAVKVRNNYAKGLFRQHDFTAWRYYMPSRPWTVQEFEGERYTLNGKDWL